MTIRYLISTICIIMLLWGCDSATEPPATPRVVRKKIVSQKKQTAEVHTKKTIRKAKTEAADKTVPPATPKVVRKKIVSQKKQTAKVRTKKTIRKAKTEAADKMVKKISPSKIKKPPVAEVETDQRPLMAKQVETQPSIQKKPAIKPKSDLSTIKQPVQIQLPKAGQKSGTSDKMIASTPTAPGKLTGIPPDYDPTGKIDPFEPLFQDKPVLAKKKKRKKRLPQTPLERIDISQLKLVGIILASSGNRALVEESSGKGYVIKKGTYIGIHSGKVVKIKKETVIVEEEIEDVFGKIATRQREIKLPKPPGEF